MPAKKNQPSDLPSGAIDLMYFPHARDDAGRDAGEVRCHEPIESVVALKQQCGLGYIFVTHCKRWACDRRIYCEDTQLDDILRYTSAHPQDFIGIGTYNPLDIAASTHHAEIGIKHHGFKGVYVQPASFGISLCDRRMYPLYVKAIDWKVPVILDVQRITDDKRISARPTDLAQIAADLPDVNFVVALPEWTPEELTCLADDAANVYYCFDSTALSKNNILGFVNSPSGQTRCIWGSNGQPWHEALRDLAHLALADPKSFLRENATRVFHLSHFRKRKAVPYRETEQPMMRIVAE